MKYKKTIIIVVLFLLSILIIVLITYKDHSSTTTNQEPERGGSPQISLINGDKLYNLMLPYQYTAVETELTIYVLSRGGDPWGQVTIVGDPTTDPHNIYAIKINANISSLNKTVEVDISTSKHGDYLYFSIPADNYSSQITTGS